MRDIICLLLQVQFGFSMMPHWSSYAAHQLWLVRWWLSLTRQIKSGLKRLCGQAIGRCLSPVELPSSVELPSFSTMHPRHSKSSLGNVTKLGSRWQMLDGKRRRLDGRTDPSGWASLAGDEFIQWNLAVKSARRMSGGAMWYKTDTQEWIWLYLKLSTLPNWGCNQLDVRVHFDTRLGHSTLLLRSKVPRLMP